MDASGSGRASLFPLHGVAQTAPQEETAGSWQHCSSFKPGTQPPAQDDGLRARAAALLTSDDSNDSDASSRESFDSVASRDKKSRKKRSSKKRKRKKRESDDRKGRKKPKSELDKILELEKRNKLRSSRGEQASGVHGWFQRHHSGPSTIDDCYFDEKGDFDNVVYEGLYRMAVPAYRRKSLVGKKLRDTSRGGTTRLRYFSPKSMMRERSRRMKKYRMLFRLKPNSSHGLALPPPATMGLEVDESMQGENDEQYILRRTKEFNIAMRERPFEMKLWIEFAQFQDEANKLLRKKGSERSTAERKIAILERGLSFHPGAEELVLLLLDCVELIEDSQSVLARWERVIDNSPGSPRIWLAYIQWRKSQFGNFSVSSIDSLYAQALQSLAVERARQARLGVGGRKLVEIEEGLARLALLSIQFDLQSGHSEHAIAKIQAILEWHFSCPKEFQTGVTSSSLATSMKNFWQAGVPRIGEAGAKGWSTWVLGDPSVVEVGADVVGGGDSEGSEHADASDAGWSGWVEVAKGQDLEAQDFPSDSEDERSSSEISEAHTDVGETEEELMDRLGLKKLEEDMAKLEQQKDIPADVLAEWLQREQDRQNDRWKPRFQDDDGEVDDIDFEDIQEWVFDLDTSRVRDSLAFGCLDLLGVTVDGEVCSNDSVLSGIRESTERIDAELGDLLFGEQLGFLHAGGEDPASTKAKLRQALCGRWVVGSKGAAEFVSAMLGVLTERAFKDSAGLCQEWILAEAMAAAGGVADGQSVQEAGRKLLGARRNHILLWVAYAKLEAQAGHFKGARKIYDAALTSLPTLDPDAQSQHPILAFNYADMEAAKGGHDANQRALTILFHLALGTPYRPFKKGSCAFDLWHDSDVTLAKRSFQERVAKAACLEAGGGVLDLCQVSWVMAGALFEEIWGAVSGTNGTNVAVNMLTNVMGSTEPSVRSQSRFHEQLQIRLCKIMVSACQNAAPVTVSPQEARDALIEGLATYPRCSTLMKMLTTFERQAYASTRLSRFLFSQCTLHPSALNHLLALGVETLRPMAKHHSNISIERALKKAEVSSSPLIWVAYLLLEAGRSGASGKRVMLRGIRACPWAKGLWLSGLKNVGSALGDKEVGEFLDVMKNKGVKMRTDVYEVLLERLDVGD